MSLDDFVDDEVESSYFEVGQYVRDGKPFDFLDKVSVSCGVDKGKVYNMALDLFNYYRKNEFPENEASYEEVALLTVYRFCLKDCLG